MHSNRFREVLLAHTPLVEPISLDEAFLDVGGATAAVRARRSAIAATIRADVEREVGVTCSVGRRVDEVRGQARLRRLQARRSARSCRPTGCSASSSRCRSGGCGGWGRRPARCSGVWRSARSATSAATPESILERLLGEQSARHLTQLAHGIDDRDVVPYEAPKSVGHEETFERDLDDEETILRELLALSGRVASRLRADGYRARTVTLKVAAGDLHDAHTVAHAPATRPTWARICTTWSPSSTGRSRGERRRIRLLGVQARGLVPGGAEQLALLRGERWGDVERAVDRIERAVRARRGRPRLARSTAIGAAAI